MCSKQNEWKAADDQNFDKTYQNTSIEFPYLLINQMEFELTDGILENYFGEKIIKKISYSRNINKYFVYFNNIGSIEVALSKIRKFPLGFKYEIGKPKSQIVRLPNQNAKAIPTTNNESEVETLEKSLDKRNTIFSAGSQKHPEFFKPPLITKEAYTNSNSLLALNDANRRYQNINYEFVLERLNIFLKKEESKYLWRSGRVRFRSKILEESIECDIVNKHYLARCASCNSYTDITCKYCRIPYCNVVCLQELHDDYSSNNCKHKVPASCKPANPKFVLSEFPSSGSRIQITAFQQTNVVYIRSMELNANVSHFNVLSAAWLEGSKALPLESQPKVGQMVIYKSEGVFNRAIVLNVEQTLAMYVVCIDYGNIEITGMENLYECSTQLANLPCYAFPVLLRGVEHRYMTPEVRYILYRLTDFRTFNLKYSSREFHFIKGMQRVVLFDVENNYSFNRLIKKQISPEEPSAGVPDLQENFLELLNIPTGNNVKLVVMDNSLLKHGILHCTTLDLAYEVTRMQRDIHAYGKSPRKFTSYLPFSLNSLCVAKFNGRWCRGLFVDYVGDGFPSIFFIDYGNIVPTHVSDIRAYPLQLKHPILTLEFSLMGFSTELSDDKLLRIEKLLPVGKIVNCDEIVQNEKDKTYSLRINQLIPLLEEGSIGNN